MKYFYIVLLFVLGPCRREAGNYIPVESLDLDNCEEITCQEIALENYLPSHPTGMFFTEGKLVIKDDKGHLNLFHTITKEGKLLQEFLQRGDGPEEYSSSDFNFQLSDNHILDVFDNSRGKIISFEEKEGRFSFLSTFSAKMNEETICGMLNCGDYYLTVGVNGRFEQNRFLVLDTLGNVKTAIGDYPMIHPDLLVKPKEDLQTVLFHTSFLRLSPDRQKAVFASYKGALIQFFDLSSLPDTISTKSIQLERPKKKEQITYEHEGWVYGFEDVYVTNSNVYAIYNGETAVDNPGLGRYILKYDWKGNLLKKYKFEMGLRSLAIDEASETAFLIGYVDDEMRLYYKE